MRSTLFYIPLELGGIPVFGFGWLLGAWVLFSGLFLAGLIRRQGFNRDTQSYLPVLLLVGLAIAFLLPALCDEQGFPVRGYGVTLVVAMASAVGLAAFRGRRMGLPPEIILSLAFWLFAFGIVGGRLFFVVQHWDAMVAAPPTAAVQSADGAGEPAPAKNETLERIGRTFVNIISINGGGLVVYGALIGGGLALICFVYKYHLHGLALADLIAPSVALGMAIGRIGCFLNGCCYGGVCDLPWAVTFPKGSPLYTPPYERQMVLGQLYGLTVGTDPAGRLMVLDVKSGGPADKAGIAPEEPIQQLGGRDVSTLPAAQHELAAAVTAGRPLTITTPQGHYRLEMMPGAAERSLPVHPTQLYSAIDAGLLCVFLIAYYPYRRRDGEVAALILTLHPVSRFLLESIRTDEYAVTGTGMTISQLISLMIFCVGVAMWIYISRRPRGSVWPQGRAATT